MPIFKCPSCGTEFEKSKHYEVILQNINLINMMMGSKDIITDYCGKCDYRSIASHTEYKEDDK